MFKILVLRDLGRYTQVKTLIFSKKIWSPSSTSLIKVILK